MQHPRLHMMRAQEQRIEEAIAAPHRRAAAEAQQSARRDRLAREGLEKLLASPLAADIMKECARSISHDLSRLVSSAIRDAMRDDPSLDGVVTITAPMSLLAFENPSSIVRKLVDRYVNDRRDGNAVRVSAGMDLEGSHLIVRVVIPSLQHEIAVSRHHFA